nr:MAG: C-5 cytosine-specific DNA methylase [Bacteriophage sp.]
MTPTTYGRDFAYCLKSHGGVRGFYASLWRFLLRCTLFCHSVATFLTSVSSYEGGCGFEVKQTQLNFPNTIQVGDVRDLNVEDLGHIDLILAGSPCTDMSFSGKRKGLSTVEGIEIKSLNEYLELKKTRI